MADRDEKVTVVESNGSGGLIAGVVAAIIVVFVLLYLFGGDLFSGGSRTVDVDVDAPKVETPAGD